MLEKYTLEKKLITSMMGAGAFLTVVLALKNHGEERFTHNQETVQIQPNTIQNQGIKFSEATTPALRNQWVEELEQKIKPPKYIGDIKYVATQLPRNGI